MKTPMSKSPAFVALVGLMALLLAMSLFMYTKLETISHDDDMNLLGGGLGRPGFVEGGFDLRKEQRHHHHHNKKKHNKKGKKGGDGGDGLFGSLGSSIGMLKRGMGMGDAIENFQAYKEHETKKRIKMGVLSTREEFEHEHGNDAYGTAADELKSKVEKLRVPDIPTLSDDLPYDIHNCPHDPPAGYPYAWNVRNVIENWNPDNTDLPGRIYQGLCVFDWSSRQQSESALNYRSHEVPFVLQNVPEVSKAAIRWNFNGPQYLKDLIGDEPIRNEHSKNNHFMYWKTRHPTPDFIPPTDMTELTYEDWYKHALEVNQLSAADQVDTEHWYFRLNSMFENHAYVYEELPFFDPTLGETMTVIHPEDHRGINCRFGMKGVIAETHYDSSSNFIAVMGGQRRYILAHPDQCEEMELYPQEHPSGRHTSIDWSTFDFENDKSNRPFTRAKVNEVVMQAGDLMYLPTYWFHFIVSLNLNYQCNSRSGDSDDYEKYIEECGFMPMTSRRKKHKK